MATDSAVREGWSYYAGSTQGPRYNNTLFRGVSSASGVASITVTLPLPIRSVVHAVATLKSTTGPGWCTVGNYSGSTFTIYFWSAATTALTFTGSVEWMAWGTLPGAAAQGEVTT